MRPIIAPYQRAHLRSRYDMRGVAPRPYVLWRRNGLWNERTGHGMMPENLSNETRRTIPPLQARIEESAALLQESDGRWGASVSRATLLLHKE
jgi:hypothetical protein